MRLASKKRAPRFCALRLGSREFCASMRLMLSITLIHTYFTVSWREHVNKDLEFTQATKILSSHKQQRSWVHTSNSILDPIQLCSSIMLTFNHKLEFRRIRPFTSQIPYPYLFTLISNLRPIMDLIMVEFQTLTRYL